MGMGIKWWGSGWDGYKIFTMSSSTQITQMIDWALTALSAQIGYIVLLIRMLQLKKVKLMRNSTMLSVRNKYNKP